MTDQPTAPQSPDDVDAILAFARTIAVVGLTDRPARDDHEVARYLQGQGLRVIPVNPRLTAPVLGERPYPDLASIPEPIDLVDVFRRAEFTDAHIDEAIAVGARAVWLQLGIRNPDGIARARAAGLLAVQDRCLMVEHRRWRAGRARQPT